MLNQLSSQQKKSGLAAWLGWMFDGLDMHIYTLVAAPFVTLLLTTSSGELPAKADVDFKSAIIQASFLFGWAVGGGFFGRIGDLIGRSRTLVLTILFYACFTGLCAFCVEWWQLMICRFLSALGIGGEWAVGASLLSESWPKNWRPWMAAVLQMGINIGILLACAVQQLLIAGVQLEWFSSSMGYRIIFLVGLLPALITLWIRKEVPETDEWKQAKGQNKALGIKDLFGPEVRNVTWRILLLCTLSLTAHWAFMFWHTSYLRALPEVSKMVISEVNRVAMFGLVYMMCGSIVGCFFAGALAKLTSYRTAMILMFSGYAAAMILCFSEVRDLQTTLWFYMVIGFCQGVFGLFTMCLPPLFPVLLRTTGAGFCYNIGRVFAAAGTVFFLVQSPVGDYRQALYYAALLFVPTIIASCFLPKSKYEN
jgi:MFS family permease